MRIDQKKPEEVAARVAEVQELHAAIVATAARPQSAETECLREEIARLRADLTTSQAECERLRADAERGAYVVEHGGWIRSERDGCSYMTIKLPLDADLSCIATRRAAIDAARAGKGE